MRKYLAENPEQRDKARIRAKRYLKDHPETYQKRRDYILQYAKDHPVPGDRKARNSMRNGRSARSQSITAMKPGASVGFFATSATCVLALSNVFTPLPAYKKSGAIYNGAN